MITDGAESMLRREGYILQAGIGEKCLRTIGQGAVSLAEILGQEADMRSVQKLPCGKIIPLLRGQYARVEILHPGVTVDKAAGTALYERHPFGLEELKVGRAFEGEILGLRTDPATRGKLVIAQSVEPVELVGPVDGSLAFAGLVDVIPHPGAAGQHLYSPNVALDIFA